MDREDEMLRYVQNRLSGDRRSAFEAVLEDDPQLASEVKMMQAVRVELSKESEALGENSSGWERLSKSIDTSTAPANDNRAPIYQIMQMAAAAVLAVGIWHFGVAPNLSGTGSFETVSEEAGGPILQVVFAQSAPMGDVSELLKQFEGRIVGGPSALGVYRVGFADEAQRAAALAALAARSDLVTDVFEQ